MKDREDDPSGGASTQGSAQAGAGGVNPRKKALSVSSDGDKPGQGKKKIAISLKDLTRAERVMRCFSAQRNMKKLFAERKYEKEEEEFEVLNFVKVYSIGVIILGNTYYYILSGPL